MVRRRWWRSAGSAQALVGSVIEWRRMAWSSGVILSHRSMPLWIPHFRGRFLNLLRSRGPAVLWGELNFGDWVGEGLLVGALLCDWWGRCLEHLFVRLWWGFRFL